MRDQRSLLQLVELENPYSLGCYQICSGTNTLQLFMIALETVYIETGLCLGIGIGIRIRLYRLLMIGYCEPFIPVDKDQDWGSVSFNEKICESIMRHKELNSNGKLVIIIDAADNAEMAA